MKEITLERLPATVEELAAMPQAALTVPGRGCGTYGCSTGEISGKSGGCSPDAGFLKGTKTVKWDR